MRHHTACREIAHSVGLVHETWLPAGPCTSSIRERWDGPVAATEVGGLCDAGCSANQVAAYTPDVQAVDPPKRMRILLDSGVDLIFWASLVESPDQEPQYQAEGLLTTDWVEKPAYGAYRELIGRVVG